MSVSQTAPPMMSLPAAHYATGPSDGEFFSQYPDYFDFSTVDTPPNQQGDPMSSTNMGEVYHDANLVGAGGQFAPSEEMDGISDIVPIGAQGAWDQGPTMLAETTSPMSHCVPMPMAPGSSNLGRIQDTSSVATSVATRPSSSGAAMLKQHPSSTGKSSAGRHKTKDGSNRKKTIAPGQTSLEKASPTPRDNIVVIPPGAYNQLSRPTETQTAPDSQTTSGYTGTPQSPPQDPSAREPSASQRARNRAAANKCRRKSKAAVAELEAAERALSSQHQELSTVVRGLREEVLGLKNELLMHGNCDCDIIHQYLSNTARNLSMGSSTAG